MICNICGSRNKDGAKFCNECANPLFLQAVDELPIFQDSPDRGIPSSVAGSSSEKEASSLPESSSLPETLVFKQIPDRGRDTTGIDEILAGPAPADTAPTPVVPVSPVSPAAVAPAPTGSIHAGSAYKTPESAWSDGGTMKMPRVAGETPEQRKEFRAPDIPDKKPGRIKKGIVAAVAAVALVAAVLVAFVFIDLPDGTNLADTIGLGKLLGGKKLPDLSNKTVDEARRQLEEAGYSVKILQAKSDTTEGAVLLMDPAAGTRVAEGSEVTLHVATPRIVPEVTGSLLADAEALLKGEGFTNVRVVKEKSNEDEGKVLEVLPASGSKAVSRDEITLTVSDPYLVPEVTGLSREEAVAKVEAEGYEVQIRYEYVETEENVVTGSEPAAGTKHNKGAVVTIRVTKSREKELVEATQATFAEGHSFVVGGSTYTVVSLDAVEYAAENLTLCTMTTSMSTFVNGEALYGETRQRSFNVTWDAENNYSVGLA